MAGVHRAVANSPGPRPPYQALKATATRSRGNGLTPAGASAYANNTARTLAAAPTPYRRRTSADPCRRPTRRLPAASWNRCALGRGKATPADAVGSRRRADSRAARAWTGSIPRAAEGASGEVTGGAPEWMSWLITI